MRGFRAVDRGRVKRRRTRGRMRRGSLACVETLRGKYTLPKGSTSAPPEAGSALRRAAYRHAKGVGSTWRMDDDATAGEREARPAPACTVFGSNRQPQRTSQGSVRKPRRIRDRAQATAEKHGSVPVETARHEKSLHRENPREPETGAPENRARGHPLESGAKPREATQDAREDAQRKPGVH